MCERVNQQSVQQFALMQNMYLDQQIICLHIKLCTVVSEVY